MTELDLLLRAVTELEKRRHVRDVGSEEGGQWVLDISAEWPSRPCTYLFPIPLQAGFQSQFCCKGLNAIEPASARLMLCQANGREQ